MNSRIKNNCSYVLVCLFLLSSFCLLNLSGKIAFAEAEEKAIVFDKETSYDIYYAVTSYEVNCIKDVRVLNTVTINGVTFLVILKPGIKDEKGYILLNSVKAVLPRDSVVKPK